MKKLTILLCTSFAALAVLSCNKGPKEEAAIFNNPEGGE